MTLGSFIHRNRTAILGLTALLAAAGGWAAAAMPVAILPEVAFHRISVIARAGSLPVAQTVTAVTQPLESAMRSVLGVETVRSMTTRGGAQIDVILGWHEDMFRALQLVQAAMEETRRVLPPDTDLEARLLDTSAFPILEIAVTSAQRTLAEMSDFAVYEAAPRLNTIPGVYRVELDGAKVREYAITLDPGALEAHRLDVTAIAAAVRAANGIAASGQVIDGYRLALTVVRGQATEPSALAGVVVAERGGIPITLGQVARIEPSLLEDFTRAAANGEPAVLIGISRQPSGDATAVSAAVRARLAELAQRHPDYQFTVFYDQADLVRQAIADVRDSIAIGLLLAVATIFLFIANARMTLVAAAVIPATVLISCIALHLLGMSFNLMTLGGIAAGIGLVLDDAIVVVENFHRHRLLGYTGESALATSIAQIAHALVGSTLTPIAVLLPLALLQGVPGAFFRPLAVTMSVALLVSLVLALSFTPALAAALESPRPARAIVTPGDRLTGLLGGFYTRVLGAALDHPWAALAAGGVVVLLATAAYQRIDTGFIPAMDEGAFVVDYWAPPGTSLQETTRLLATVDEILRATPEVSALARRTGSEMGFFLTESSRGDYTVRLHSGRRRPIEAVIDDVRGRIEARVPGLRVDFVEILQDMIGDLSGNPSPIEIKLFGPDMDTLRRTAQRVEALIATVPGVVDSFDGITPIGPTYEVTVDEQRAHQVGLDAAAVRDWLDTAITGVVVGQVNEGDRAIALRLRYPDRYRDHLDALGELTLVTPQGQLAPLRTLARFDAGALVVQRDREDSRQLVRVTARISGGDLGSVGQRIRQLLAHDLALPAGVTLEYGGLYASQQQSFAELLVVGLGAIACVAALLLVEFGSVAAAAAIILGSSVAVSGSLAALWATGTALNVSSVVGMIMVVGIVAKNGILLLDLAGREHERTGDLRAALLQAGAVRLRPILMTSLAALAGLAPLALGIGAGGQMQQPLAIAILGGVAVSMFFSLIAIPMLYRLLVPAEAPHATARS